MKFCLIGEKLSHSFSKVIHNLTGVEYSLVEVSKEALEKFVRSKDYNGFNVTIPYKKEIIKYLDGVSNDAISVGAVNTVVRRDNKTFGYNTDVSGFEYALKRKGVSLKGKNVIILGTGGASKAVEYVCIKQGAKTINFVSRSGKINYQNCYDLKNVDVIINATPIGMYPEIDSSPIDLSKFTNLSFVFDLIYNPQKTELLYQAEKLGVPYSNGLSMLVKQAVDAQEIWGLPKTENRKVEEIINKISKDKLNVVLTGMPGCGKTTIGKILAEKLNKEFIDLDCEITFAYKKSPKDIILSEGEEKFRKIESEVLKTVCNKNGVVIALGGGAFISETNRKVITLTGISFYVKRDIDKLITEDRPLSQISGVRELYNQRKSDYEKADFSVDNNDKPISCVKEIIEKYENFSY